MPETANPYTCNAAASSNEDKSAVHVPSLNSYQMSPALPINSPNMLPLHPQPRNYTNADHLYCFELCCGSANLSWHLQRAGFRTIAVDFDRNPNERPKVKVTHIDLSTQSGHSTIHELQTDLKPYVVHIAPPCGTASKAREKPIPKWLKSKGAPEPRQLRSSEYPRGLPNLAGIELIRVEKANSIYDFTIELCIGRHQRNELWSMENPSTSYYWELPRMIFLMSLPGTYCADFMQCCHGGQRPVWRRWVGNFAALLTLIAICPGVSELHVHANFGINRTSLGWKFDTASEAAYPNDLCKKYAGIVVSTLPAGATPTQSLQPKQETSHKAALRASVGMYVRGNKFPALIPEFDSVEHIPAISEIEPGKFIDLHPNMSSKVLECSQTIGNDAGAPYLLKVGTYRNPEAFIHKAMELRHPIDSPSFLPEGLVRNIFKILTTDPSTVAKERLDKIRTLRTWAIELSGANTIAMQKLDVSKSRILCTKNLMLLGKVLEHISYPDKNLVRDLMEGTTVVGDVPTSSVFLPKESPAVCTPESLLEPSRAVRKSVIDRITSSGDEQIDTAVWEETVKEVNNQWLSAQMSLSEIEAVVGPLFVIARRFGIKQSGKIRAIDDYSISGANQATSSHEKLDLLGTDEVFAMLKLIASSVDDAGNVRIQLPSGELLKGKVPHGQTPGQARDWLGKAFDLKSAYRQIPTSRSGLNPAFTVIGVFNPEENQPAYFLQYATPFGAVSSVYLFNRVARAIWAIGIWTGFTWANYFDDFPILDPSATAATTDIAVRAMCSLLGWDLALDEKKNRPFSKKFGQLGLVANLTELCSGTASYENKPERVAELGELISQVVSAGKCPKPLMAEIRGKGQYSASHVAGRVSAGVLHELGDHQYRAKSDVLSARSIELLLRLKLILSSSPPRSINCHGETRPIIVFTDGAVEGANHEIVTVGALVIDSATSPPSAFMWGGRVDDKLVSIWKAAGNVQVIGQAELLPTLLVRMSNSSAFVNRRIIFMIDNDSARQALMKGYSKAPASRLILQMMVELELSTVCWAWYSRVPTRSNPADAPSRLELIPGPDNFHAKVVPMPPIPERLYGMV